jgi:hypothetical protein
MPVVHTCQRTAPSAQDREDRCGPGQVAAGLRLHTQAIDAEFPLARCEPIGTRAPIDYTILCQLEHV